MNHGRLPRIKAIETAVAATRISNYFDNDSCQVKYVYQLDSGVTSGSAGRSSFRNLAVAGSMIITLALIPLTSSYELANAATWAKSYGGVQDENVFRSVVALSDGGHVIAGVTNSTGAGMNDIWIIRLNSSGNILWQKTYGGARNEETRSIQQTADGGFVVTGPTNSFGSGANDIWVIKLNSAGAVQWQKTYGGSLADVSHAIQQTVDGGYVVAGFTKSFGTGLQDYFVIKLNATGGIVWQKAFGGAGNDVIRFVKQVSDGGYLAAGFTHSFGTKGDIMLVKMDANGNMEWDMHYGGAKFEEPSTILEVADGYIVLEQSNSFSGNTDGWLFKVDTDGQIVWQKRVGGGSFDELSAAQQTPDGGFIAAGETKSFGIPAEDFWVVKFDSSGGIAWQKRYGGSNVEEAESIALTPDGGYVVVGTTRSFSEGLRDIWTIKLDSSGALSGCGPGVTVQSTTASTFATNSASTDAGAVATNAAAKVKNSVAQIINTNANVSTQCSS